MIYFVDSYRGIIEEKSLSELKKSSLYQYRENKTSSEAENTNKTSNLTFESNEEKEELEAIQQNFPNHLEEFQDVINPLVSNNDSLLSNNNVDNNNKNKNLATTDVMNEDMIGYLVGIHSRMVFIYLSDHIQQNECLFEYNTQLNNYLHQSTNLTFNSTKSTPSNNSNNSKKIKLNSKKLKKKKS